LDTNVITVVATAPSAALELVEVDAMQTPPDQDALARTVRLAVNGQAQDLVVTARSRLIDVLRDGLGLTGTKEGCSIGVCGSCTVLVDGKPVSACLTFAITLDGSTVSTIEGLGQPGKPHPIQQAFMTAGGFQCGFCTPGQIMAAKALLDEHPEPTDEEIREGMLGNLCRCTGYYKIIDSIRLAATELATRSDAPAEPATA
jgi:aerobic carbon-monoxide dehydrogenase small subunit